MSAFPLVSPAARETRARLTAADVMTARVITVRPETPVKDVAALMAAHHISGLPVVTGEGELVGIVTEADLLHKEAGFSPAGPLRRAVKPFGRSAGVAKKVSALTAADLMSAPVIGVAEATPLHEVAALMVRRRINRVPVLRADRVVGIVSRADIVRAFTRTDAEVAAAVRATLLQDLWVDVTRIEITVRAGVVHLDGQVERRSERDLVLRWVGTVDGVIGVESHLEFEYDDRGLHLADRWPVARV